MTFSHATSTLGQEIVGMPATQSHLARIARRAIKGYQWLTAGAMPRCRFAPSCSHYAHDAIEEYGAIRGIWMGMRRIGRCHPWNEGGFDPVPARSSQNATKQLANSLHDSTK